MDLALNGIHLIRLSNVSDGVSTRQSAFANTNNRFNSSNGPFVEACAVFGTRVLTCPLQPLHG